MPNNNATAILANFTGIGRNSSFLNCTYNPQILIGCDQLHSSLNATPTIFNANLCFLQLYVATIDGCPYIDIDRINKQIQSIWFQLGWAMFLVLIAAGIGIGAYGSKLWNIIVFILLFLTFSLIILVLTDFLLRYCRLSYIK
jgi:hypothetical protein